MTRDHPVVTEQERIWLMGSDEFIRRTGQVKCIGDHDDWWHPCPLCKAVV